MNISPENQLRADRRSKLRTWLARTDGDRWDGDDGRQLWLDEWQWWPQAAKDAEQAYFEAELDPWYEAEKVTRGLA